jgi:hypothetical protein
MVVASAASRIRGRRRGAERIKSELSDAAKAAGLTVEEEERLRADIDEIAAGRADIDVVRRMHPLFLRLGSVSKGLWDQTKDIATSIVAKYMAEKM